LIDVFFYYYIEFLEYNEAREWIEKSFNCDSDSVDKFNSHFEITIRILGGLLSIYHLSADEIFLKRAVKRINKNLKLFFFLSCFSLD
jgi:mannosyl-oligosaccharide alpha-1,2-mannosidase